MEKFADGPPLNVNYNEIRKIVWNMHVRRHLRNYYFMKYIGMQWILLDPIICEYPRILSREINLFRTYQTIPDCRISSCEQPHKYTGKGGNMAGDSLWCYGRFGMRVFPPWKYSGNDFMRIESRAIQNYLVKMLMLLNFKIICNFNEEKMVYEWQKKTHTYTIQHNTRIA